MTDDVAARLVALGVATLHEAMGRRNLAAGIRLLVGEPFAGRALTVELPAGDNLGIHLALEAARPGAVLCAGSAGGGLYGALGELLAESARARGLRAIVLDDGIRDLGVLAAPPAIAARGVSPLGTTKGRLRRPVGADVVVGGALVRDGDWLVCDADGLCVVPAEDAGAVLERARARAEREDGLRRELREGASSRELLGLPGERPSSVG